jgi:uracil-DNA glycosylase
MTEDKMLSWAELEKEIENCRKCPLFAGRTKAVLGRGNKDAQILLVGEGPGGEEDLRGEAFVGAAGILLDSLLCAVGFQADDIYIANIVKCRPPGNRVPTEDEAETCMPYLRNQAFLVRPKIIVCLGSTAAKYILRDKNLKITAERGRLRQKNGYSYMPTYHPAALLRDPSKKIDMYGDFRKVKELYDKIKEAET